jgi:hypothetical protein
MFVARHALRFAAIVVVAIATACSSEGTSGPAGDPLAGLTIAERGDTAPAPPVSTPRSPGYFVGTVYGYEPGPDTLASAVRLEGARVTAYIRVDGSEGVTAGRQVASVFTNAQGYFQLPTLPGGEYVVAFVPAAASPYQGGWTVAEAWQQSGDSPWWIMLPRK